MLLAFLCRAFDFEVVNVGSRDGFDEFPFPQVSFEVFQNFLVALQGFGLVRGVDADMVGK